MPALLLKNSNSSCHFILVKACCFVLFNLGHALSVTVCSFVLSSAQFSLCDLVGIINIVAV